MSPHNRAPKSRKKGKKSNTFPNSYSLKKKPKTKEPKKKKKTNVPEPEAVLHKNKTREI